MIDSAETGLAKTGTASLKQAAMVGSALALVVGVASPANATVITHTLGSPITVSLNAASSNAIDLNGDSITDYTLVSSGGCSVITTCSISVVPSGSNQVYIDTFFSTPGRQLAARYSSFGQFETDFYTSNPFKVMAPQTGVLAASDALAPPTGDWNFDGASGNLGLEFQIGAQNYLGFIHGTVSDPTNDSNLSIAFDSYGYDTKAVPGVPEADTLSLLAMGMVGVGALRRRRRKAVKA